MSEGNQILDSCTGGSHMYSVCLTVAGLTFAIIHTVNNRTAHFHFFLNILKFHCSFWKLDKLPHLPNSNPDFFFFMVY